MASKIFLVLSAIISLPVLIHSLEDEQVYNQTACLNQIQAILKVVQESEQESEKVSKEESEQVSKNEEAPKTLPSNEAIETCCLGLKSESVVLESKSDLQQLVLRCLLLDELSHENKNSGTRSERSPLRSIPDSEVLSRSGHQLSQSGQRSPSDDRVTSSNLTDTNRNTNTSTTATSNHTTPCPEIVNLQGAIWSRIGTGSLLTSLSILILILVYFIINSKEKKGEHLYLFLTILLSGFGNLGAGFVLSHVQNWKVFLVISQLLILEPTLLGLKGNIEMCMASRLATQANLGNMSTWKKTFEMIRGNLALDLTQAIVVSFIAAVSVSIFSLIQGDNSFPFGYTLSIVLSASMLTASSASIILGSTLVIVIITSHKLKLDPDNIGAPVGASLGDVITLSLLSAFSVLIFNLTPLSSDGHGLGSHLPFPVVPFVIILIILLFLPVFVYNSYYNQYTRKNLSTGWIPIFVAVILSTASGFILDFAAHDFIIYSTFQPVMNGVGGNIVAIHASRMSTHLHKSGSDLGKIPSGVKMYRNPVKAFFDPTEVNVEMGRNLVLMSIPAHILYLFLTATLKSDVTLTIPFILIYSACAITQMVLLLYIAYHLVNMMWKSGIDPDNTVIPILTATGDFLGSLFLLLSFLILRQINDVNGG